MLEKDTNLNQNNEQSKELSVPIPQYAKGPNTMKTSGDGDEKAEGTYENISQGGGTGRKNLSLMPEIGIQDLDRKGNSSNAE